MNIRILEDQEEHRDICHMFWEIDDSGEFKYKVSEIAIKYGGNVSSIRNIVKQSCIVYSDEICCSLCDLPYSFTSRTNFKVNQRSQGWVCDECIENEKETLNDKKSHVLRNALESSLDNSLDIEQLDFRYAIFLISLFRFSGSEDLSHIRGFSSNQTDLFSPNSKYNLPILNELYENKIIAVSPLTDLGNIELEENGFRFYLGQVDWVAVLSGFPPMPYVIGRLEEKMTSMDYIESSYDAVVELCREVCLHECLGYLDYVLLEYQLDFEAGKKTHLVLNKALENFSVSQVYNFIWRSTKDAAAFYLRSGVSRKHAANTIVSSIQKQCERALGNNWDVKSFQRNYHLPQSMVSQVLFNTCLHTDDGGFSQQLSKII